MDFPIVTPDFLLPKDTDLKKWSVVACDQYTSDRNYWEELKKYIGGIPSALDLILPECYLSDNFGERVEKIGLSARKYLRENVFSSLRGFVYIERKLRGGLIRRGFLALVDLDAYDYKKDSKALIRASERTVEERLPPRVQIRKVSDIEIPHIMLLIDDKDGLVFNALENSPQKPLYDFALNMGGGNIKGALIEDGGSVSKALEQLSGDSEKKFGERVLAAVGDGNHSLASAKMCWENEKKEKGAVANGKLRYALAEIVNIYDEALLFEPIHRAVFVKDLRDFKAAAEKYFADKYSALPKREYGIFFGAEKSALALSGNVIAAIAEFDGFIEGYVLQNGGSVDYIHGESELKSLCAGENAAGLLFTSIDKSGFFPYIINKGCLPKKTFSMGEAYDKRYYLEARAIR